MKKCKICGIDIPEKRTYCSNKCKFSDDEYNKSRIGTNKNNKQKYLKCTICGHHINDVLNLSGAVTVHLKSKHNITLKKYDKYFTIHKLPFRKMWQCPRCNWKTPDRTNKSGCITNHMKSKHNFTLLELNTQYPDSKIETLNLKRFTNDLLRTPDDYITCQICNEKMAIISNTHCLHKHNITQDEYKEKFGDDITSKTLSDTLQQYGGSNGIYRSKGENEVIEFIRSLGVKCIQTYRKLGIELDIFIPDYNIAIEYNGLYWHSEIYGNRDKNYHIDKTNICEKNGIKLTHIFEDEWQNKQELLKTKFKYLFNKFDGKSIFARNCIIKEISSDEKSGFLNKNHIQGNDKSKIKLGAFYNNILVATSTFSDKRIILGSKKEKNVYELNRFAINAEYKVVGILPKLLKYFRTNYKPIKIITYADIRYSTDTNIYSKIGFEYIGKTKPSYYYMKKYKKRLHRYNFTKHRIVERGGDKNLTEWENMQQNGYDRIWDCGNYKYELNY